MTALFDIAGTLTPRADWLLKHSLVVHDYQNRHTGGWDHHSLNTARFLCANRAMTRYASGETEEAAEAAFCARYGLPWWKLEGYVCEITGPVVRAVSAAPVITQMEIPPQEVVW